MKKIGMQMSICMGVTLSLCLSLLGNLMGGHFSLPGFLISFLLSTFVSLVIGFLVPMQKVGGAACRKAGIPERSPKGNALSSLISDLIYTPVITLCNVFLGYRNAVSHGSSVPFAGMFIKSLAVSLVVAYVLIFLLTPLFLKMILKKNGIDPNQPPR